MEKPYLEAEKHLTKHPDLDRFDMHIHEFYEIYCFLSGNAKYYVEGIIYPLHPGDIMLIKKSDSHSLLITHDTPYERIIIHFNAAAILNEYRNTIVSFIDKSSFIFPSANISYNNFYLEKIVNNKDVNIKRLYLTVMLEYFFENQDELACKNYSKSPMADIIEFINLHLTDQLSLDILCSRFYISKSQLNRNFKQLIGSTVWEYIKEKRLLLAKELLKNGTQPTEVCIKCGFNDYSTFFYAYRSKFNTSPKADYVKIR